MTPYPAFVKSPTDKPELNKIRLDRPYYRKRKTMKNLTIPLLIIILLTTACASVMPASADTLVPTQKASSTDEPIEKTLPAPITTSENQLADCPICQVDMAAYDGPLNEAEVQALLLALNDEYHAWAIYDQVLQDLGQIRPFTNIVQAEAKHIESLVRLMEKYELAVPENPWPGNVPSFDSSAAACTAAAEAEVLNAALYDQLLDSTERDDILTVYRSLQRASEENHLPAFERCATRQGSRTK